jgi:hypothetical protein
MGVLTMNNDLPYPQEVSLSYLFKDNWFREDWHGADLNKQIDLYQKAVTLIMDYHKRQDFRLKYFAKSYSFHKAELGLLAGAMRPNFKRHKEVCEVIKEYGEPLSIDDERWYEPISITSKNVKINSFLPTIQFKPYLDLRFQQITIMSNDQVLIPYESELSISWSQIFVPDFYVIKFEQYYGINGRVMPKHSENIEVQQEPDKPHLFGSPENPTTKKRNACKSIRQQYVSEIYQKKVNSKPDQKLEYWGQTISQLLTKEPYNLEKGTSAKSVKRDLKELFPDDFQQKHH